MIERADRKVSRTSDASNRYKIRYTRTQDRSASRQVNDHGRVSGTHRVRGGRQQHVHESRPDNYLAAGNNWPDGRYSAVFTAAARTPKLGGEAK